MSAKPNSCKDCKFFNGMTWRNEFECMWLYKRQIPLPPFLIVASNPKMSAFYSTDDCYPKRFKEDLGEHCKVFEK